MDIELSVMLQTFSERPLELGQLRGWVVALDAAGFDRAVLADHVAFGHDLAAYSDPAAGGVRGGRQPTSPDGNWLEPLATISYLAAATGSVRFATGILLAALRGAVVLAKTTATIDVLSGGRLDLGVGVGWQRLEYEAAGVPFERRGRVLDETLEVCQRLWTEQAVTFRGPTIALADVHQMPKPLQPGGIPIWVSGTLNPATIRRLARFGQGWIPWGDDARDLAASVPRMREAVARHGRDPATIGVVGALRAVRRGTDEGDGIDVAATLSDVATLVDAGVTDVRVSLRAPLDRSEMADTAHALVAEFDRRTGRRKGPVLQEGGSDARA